jgi:hypothetical protein
VHGLFDLLLNFKWEGDVPALFSSQPFTNCALKKLQVTYNGSFSRTNSEGKIETLKKIDLEGFVSPDQYGGSVCLSLSKFFVLRPVNSYLLLLLFFFSLVISDACDWLK